MLPIATTDMYAREAFRFENGAALCPFLSGLDEEEVAAQKTEESEIKKEMVHQHSMTEAVVGGSVAGVLTGLLVGNILSIVTGGASKAFEIIVGLISGVVSGLGLGKYVYENKNFARKGALIKLEIARYRAIRLDNKVNRITTQLLNKDLSLQEKQQLWKARFFFQETLTKYSGVRFAEPKADQPSNDTQGTRNTEASPAAQERHDEPRTTPQSDAGVQTESPNVASVAVSSESEERIREPQKEPSAQGGDEQLPHAEAVLEEVPTAKEKSIPPLVEGSETSPQAMDGSDRLTEVSTREAQAANEIKESQALPEEEESLDGLSPQREGDGGLVVEKKTPCPHESEEWPVPLPEDEEPLGCKMAAAPFMEKGAVENVQQKIEQEIGPGLSDEPLEIAPEEAVLDVPEVLEDQKEESAKLQVTIAQVDELQKRGLKLGSTLKSFLEKEGGKSELVHSIVSLARANSMPDPLVQQEDIGFRNKNGKAHSLVNQLAGIGETGRLSEALREKLEHGYDLLYDKKRRVFSDREKARLANFHSLLLMLSKQPVGIMHRDLKFGVHFAQVVKGLTAEEQKMLQEFIDLRWPSCSCAPPHIELLKRAWQE